MRHKPWAGTQERGSRLRGGDSRYERVRWTGAGVVAVVVATGILAIASSPAVAAKPKPHKKGPKPVLALKPGTYSGTVQMAVTVGTTTYQAHLAGTWTLTVDKRDHATGNESLQGTVPFTSPDSSGCTYSPTSWTLGFLANLGTDTLAQGTPGTVKGANLVISLSNTNAGGWSGTPAQYTRTCGNYPGQWPTGLAYGFGPSTGAPVEEKVQFPLSFLKTHRTPFTLQLTTIENAMFTQTYTLTSSP